MRHGLPELKGMDSAHLPVPLVRGNQKQSSMYLVYYCGLGQAF